jgi:hypothetical protein
MRESPLDQLAPPPQQLLASMATDSLPISVDCRLLCSLACPLPPSAIRFGNVGPHFKSP